MDMPRMPLSTASAVTFLYALGYPIGALAVAAMTPMAALVLRFSLAASILAIWTVLVKAPWPRGAQFGHVVVAGLLIQAVQFCSLYEALQLGSPAVLGAMAIAMNPVTTAILGAVFLREPLGPQRLAALTLGVVAVLAACARRLMSAHGVDPVILLLVLALLGLSAGGVYQQRFCAGVDFRAMSAMQNAIALIPAAALAILTPFSVHDGAKAAIAVGGMVLLNATLAVSLYLRAINTHGAAGGGDAVRRHSRGRRGAVVADARAAPGRRSRGRPGRRRVRVLAQHQGIRPAPRGARRLHQAEAAAHKCRRRGMNSSVNSTNTKGISWVIEISA